MLTLDQIQTVALAGLVLFIGYGVRRFVPFLAAYNIPAPVIGGLLMALFVTISRAYGWTPLMFTPTLQLPLMIAFFTTIGFGASLSLLRIGGPAVVLFFVLSTIMAVGQNVIGVAAAYALGQHPLMGVLAGSVTLTGGPATGLAFAPLFEAAGVPAAATLAVAAAMAGIVAGGVVGGPVATWLLGRLGRKPGAVKARGARALAEHVVENKLAEPPPTAPVGEDVEAYGLLKGLVLILAAMWIGTWVSAWFVSMGATFPAYIGAMLVAAIIRNVDDATKVIGVSQRTIDDLGATALSLFLVMALMTLRLWDLVGVALPLAVMLILQIVAIMVVAGTIVFRLMGRDYEAAVMAGGFCGFMLGTTANAMANMEALVERYGPAPKAFLVVPMVGAFFVDFTNAIIITACLNIWG
ncbi:MAG TPA: sodium/glutamate symporter [Vicinamibacterales bacterium]|nr:sodium/glutamate symporter [Vicinamibacterales bacterium]